jgi:RNA polymerase sigma-70 factor (ECF subfamily)
LTVVPAQSFKSTHWSVVLAAAGDSQSSGSQAALERLCQTYWYPLYAYVRGRGYAEQDAKDLTQGFFAQVLKRKGLRGLLPGRVKFRSFLLTALKNFLADEHARQQAQKRGGGQVLVSIDAQDAEQRYLVEPAHNDTPERQFERRWAVALLDSARARLKAEFEASGKGVLFGALSVLNDRESSGTYAETAARLEMSEEAVKKAVQRMRKRYLALLREEIAQTVGGPAEVEEELRQLRAVLAGQA